MAPQAMSTVAFPLPSACLQCVCVRVCVRSRRGPPKSSSEAKLSSDSLGTGDLLVVPENASSLQKPKASAADNGRGRALVKEWGTEVKEEMRGGEQETGGNGGQREKELDVEKGNKV